VSYNDSNFSLAFFNKEPIVHSLQLLHGNRKLTDVEVEEQKIDFSTSFDDICEQLKQEIPNDGVQMYIVLFLKARLAS